MRIVLLGPPGSGKGVQGEKLRNKFRRPRISTGDMFREAVQKQSEEWDDVRQYLEAGKLVPDDVVIKMIRKRLSSADCEYGFILDGFPRTVSQGESLEKMLKENNMHLDCVVSLEVPNKVIIERIITRRVCSGCGAVFNIKTSPPPENNICAICGGKIIQRSDDQEETILGRLKVYDEQTKPLKEFYSNLGILSEIDGDGSVEEISNRIIDLLKKISG